LKKNRLKKTGSGGLDAVWKSHERAQVTTKTGGEEGGRGTRKNKYCLWASRRRQAHDGRRHKKGLL